MKQRTMGDGLRLPHALPPHDRRAIMPQHPYDSSKTRVVPVLEAISASGPDWLRRLLSLPSCGAEGATVPSDLDLCVESSTGAQMSDALHLHPRCWIGSSVISSEHLLPKTSPTLPSGEGGCLIETQPRSRRHSRCFNLAPQGKHGTSSKGTPTRTRSS